MKQFFYNKFLVIMIIIGLVASLVINCQRHQVEVANNSVELIVDYEDLMELAAREGIAPAQVMKQAKEAAPLSMVRFSRTGGSRKGIQENFRFCFKCSELEK